MGKCKDCEYFKGNCGHHFKDSDGHICWDIARESMYDGVIGNTPKCFSPSKEYQEKINRKTAEEIAKYPIEVINMALAIKENADV